MAMTRRRDLVATARRAVRDPAYARRQLRRTTRDLVLRARYRGDHIGYYRAVMQDAIQRGETTAVGDRTSKKWQRGGKRQFDYLVGHGLLPEHRMLDIGCGNLRAGRRFIDHLDAGHYYGIDISPEAILSAQATVRDHGLAAKLPYLTVVDDLTFTFLPDGHFDVVHAHSVFSHCPLDVIEECFGHIGRVMKPDAFFDFTFYRSDDKDYGRLREEFRYRIDTLTAAAERHGFNAQFMDDWEGRHVQSKMRLTLAG